MDDYDVFLNHRGPDVKAGFIAHLEEALRSAGLNPFLDKTSLVKGGTASRSIDAALEAAKIHVAVVSRGYAESKHCLNELVAMTKSRKPMIPVFYGVEPAELRWVENGQFAAAFEKHKSRESPEQVKEWADALRKLADTSGFSYRLCDNQGDEAKLKRKLVDAILNLTPTIDTLQMECYIVGLEEHKNICINTLEKMFSTTITLGLVGMGGVGKTTLAKEIYNHFVCHKYFQAMSFLEFDHISPSSLGVGSSLLSRLQKQLLQDILNVSDNNRQSYKHWFHKLSNWGPILLVLDDVHDKSQFDELILDTSLLALGSHIIVTSRDRHLLKIVAKKTKFYIHEVTTLGCDDSKKLFNWHAFGDEEAPKNFKDLANVVSRVCGGLPLALKVVGSSLFDKTSSKDQECIWPEAVDALKEDINIMSALRWSYTCLSESEKLMFVDIACVFYGWKKQEALEIWQSCKNCSSCCSLKTPHTTLRKLIDKSLIMLENSGGCDILAMHSLLRDMGHSIGMFSGTHLWEGRATKAIEDKSEVPNKLRALNLANNKKYKLKANTFAKMPNLHFLIIDGCNVSGNLGKSSKELRWLQWKNVPLTHLPPQMLNLSNLISLDFSQSNKLVNIWAASDPALEACPNLLRLNLSDCTSISTLPESIGRLSRLQVLNLFKCKNLQTLPTSIGQLRALQQLDLFACRSLEALPDAITALSGLQQLYMEWCSSISKLPTTMGLMTGLIRLQIDLATEWQVVGLGQLNALTQLGVSEYCTDEVIAVLDSLGTFRNLHQLADIRFFECKSITKLPDTIGLLTSLDMLELYSCKHMQELPNSIGQLKNLKGLRLTKCSSLETLPDSLGALISLEDLWIVQCTSITRLPTSIGNLQSLCALVIQCCSGLQSLPESISQLDALRELTVIDCGTLDGLGALTMLQGLRIWGCTSITELPGTCLMVVDGSLSGPAPFYVSWEERLPVRRRLKELRLLEANDFGILCLVEDTQNGRVMLQRVHRLPPSCNVVIQQEE